MARTATQEAARLAVGQSIKQTRDSLRQHAVTVKGLIDNLIAIKAVIVAGQATGEFEANDASEIDAILATWAQFEPVVTAYLAQG